MLRKVSSKKFYTDFSKLQELDYINPQLDNKYCDQFLQKFSCKESALNHKEKQQVEKILLGFSENFAKHRLDVWYNLEIKIKLTPEHDQPIYTQNPPIQIDIREELQVELALLQHFFITSLNNSRSTVVQFLHTAK